MSQKKSLLIGAAVAAVSIGGLGAAGVVSAATTASSTKDSSIADKLATKFNLNKDEVKAVFDEDRSSREADRTARQAERLATAVKDGKLTQAQADYITKAQAEIKALRGTASPDSESEASRTEMKERMDALRKWATDNNVDAKYLGGGHGGGFGGPGGPRGEKPDTE